MSQKTDLDLPMGCAVQGPVRPGFESILTREALEFVAELARKFGPRVKDLLARREAIVACKAGWGLSPQRPCSGNVRRTSSRRSRARRIAGPSCAGRLAMSTCAIWAICCCVARAWAC